MKNKDKRFVKQVDFKEQTPELLIGNENQDFLSDKAILSRENKCKTEFAQDTTTWD